MTINFSNSTSKIKALVDGISQEVMHGGLKAGDNLLSINEASALYKVSRDTVFKAYKLLKDKGVIDSNPMRGYFVSGEVNHILLLLDTYSAFKQDLYHRFVAQLPEGYKVDLIFHQYNERLFETIIHESIGRYSMYVVMNFSNERFSESLRTIPAGKLLLLDFGNFEKSEYSFVCQNFNEALYNCLLDGEALLKNYRKLVFVFPEELCHPVSAIDYFVNFCNDRNFEYEIIRRQSEWKGVTEGTAYLCIVTEDLVKIIKDADHKGLQLGKSVGIIAYNDDPIHEIIRNGITTISIDFGILGEKAAQFVLTRTKIQEYLPTRLTIRNSL